jgi:hypothetical protein
MATGHRRKHWRLVAQLCALALRLCRLLESQFFALLRVSSIWLAIRGPGRGCLVPSLFLPVA